MSRWLYLFLSLTIASAGCRKLYAPKAVIAQNNFLVVEGNINSGTDSTFIKLNRTVKLTSKTTVRPELNAIVSVESDQNISYPLTEQGNGTYACAGLNLDNSRKYRLSIKTSDASQYLSDFVEVVNSPPIDSVTYDTNGSLTAGSGLNIYVNAHDATNKAKYYRWDYQETWQFHANFHSYFKSNGDTVLVRDLINDNITNCWKSDTSSTIVLGSSAKLAQNIILNNPITFITSSSEKVGTKYSILVKQYALTADAYHFYSIMKKNTEQLGSVFDAQPSDVNGNIHSITNPAEPVIGYITVGSVSNQRIFVATAQLPQWETIPFYPNCILALDPKHPCCYYNAGGGVNQVDFYINYNISHNPSPFIPVDAIGRPGSPPVGYTASTKECVDCTLRGTNKRPAFWQ